MGAVVFMPWANLKEPVELGNVRFQLWSQARTQIKGECVAVLDEIFSRFYDCDGSPLSYVTIGEFDGQILDLKVGQQNAKKIQAEFDECRNAANALAFATVAPGILAAIAKNSEYDGPSTGDRFTISRWDLPVGKRITFKVGSAYHRWDLDRLHIRQPLHAIVRNDAPNQQAVKDLTKLFELAATGQEDARRIIRALGLFKESQTNSPDVSFRSKLVMLSTAFEILLKFPERGVKARPFAEQIDAMKSPAGIDIRSEALIDGKPQVLSRKAIWSYEFYKLRNRIVHGDQVQPWDIWFEVPKCSFLNFDLVACVLFNECVAVKMAELGCNNLLSNQPWLSAYKLIGWVD